MEGIRILVGALLVLLLLGAIGALPIWPHAQAWGYYPSGGLLVIVLVLLVLIVAGRL